ncbi:hypothetical protein SDC9_68605 [bioreactor metagenome]|uniref:Uncharacterized protein n=1 Tax=bioreactor metagenome TaxID=1076179 RepID=A0A644Y7Q2_9ZZZZ
MDGLIAALSPPQFFLKAGCHQYGVVHRGAQLHTANDGGSDKRNVRSGKIGYALIDKDSKLNGAHQHHRDGNGLKHAGDDEKDRRDGDVIRDVEVHGGGFNQVVCHGRLAGNQGVRVVLLDDAPHLLELVGYGIRRGGVLGVHHHHLPATLLEHGADLVGNKEFRDACAQHGVIGQH